MNAEVAAELAFHLEMTTVELMQQGMNEHDARAEASRRFGDRAAVDVDCRRLARQRDRVRSRVEYLDELRQDASFAVRQLARARTFALVAIGTLGLGIGATACVFSVLHTVVLQPLPFDHPGRIVTLLPTERGTSIDGAAGAELATMRGLSNIFDGVSGTLSGVGFTYLRGSEPVVTSGAAATAEFFHVLGAVPALGRAFVPSDDQPGAPHVVVLSHRMWMRNFAADDGILGRGIVLNGEKYAVIGVMPASFDLVRTGDDLWVPLQPTTAYLQEFDSRSISLVARLRPNVSVARATAAARTAERTLEQRFPKSGNDFGMDVHRFADDLVVGYRDRLLVLLGAVGFVLLIACVNVANLLLSRGAARSPELAIRAALGAGRGRLVRQLLVESAVLALAGAVLGTAIAFVLLRGFIAISPDSVPRLDQAHIDWTVLAFTLGLAAASSVIVGLVPALRTAAAALQSVLREGGRWSSGGRDRLRAVLVGTEVALAMTLLTGAGLLIRTARSVQQVDPGFAARHVFAGRLILPQASYGDSARIVDTYDQIDDAMARVPGVVTAALVSLAPLSDEGHMATSVEAEGAVTAAGRRNSTDFRLISPKYFATLGIPVIAGRDFRRTDDARAPLVAIVSQSLARKLWPGQRAIGKRVDGLNFGSGKRYLEIVGVVGDLHDGSLTQPVLPMLYTPYAQTPGPLWKGLQGSLVVVAHTAPDPHSLYPAIHRAILSIDASLPFADEHTMDEFLHGSLATARFNMLLLSTLGAIALLLASVGIYGVVSYFVSQRTREIGVRIALGALPRHVWRLVLARGLVPIAGGAVAGAALSFATTGLLRHQLYGVRTTDPLTLLSVLALLFVVAVAATLVPARRAMRVPPAVALQGT